MAVKSQAQYAKMQELLKSGRITKEQFARETAGINEKNVKTLPERLSDEVKKNTVARRI